MASTHPASAELRSGDWSDDELTAAVRAYITMLRAELNGEPYIKAQVNRKLRADSLAGRTKASVEFRMQNISATLYDMRLPRIGGYLPAKNVGSSVKQRIRSVLEANGIAGFEIYRSTANSLELEANVSALRRAQLVSSPPGSVRPRTVETTTLTYIRDPAVKAWVLQISGGVCEGCDTPAPFMGADGLPFLEVHHVVPLAHFGSDRTSNAVALCPNCHRRCHHSFDKEEFKLSLYEKISRLQIEVPDGDLPNVYHFIDVD